MVRSTILIAGLSIAAATACGSSVDPTVAEEGGVGEQEVALDLRDPTFKYYEVRRDLRKCAFPLCGGYLVKALNRTLTSCADGRVELECYAASADFTALRLVSADSVAFEEALLGGHAVARATLHRAPEPELAGLGRLTVREGWRAATDATPKGTFYRLAGIGRQCFGLQSPCVSIDEAELNGTFRTLLSGVDLRPSGAPTREISAALEEMGRTGILAAGTNRAVASAFPLRPRRELLASQFYLRVPPSPGKPIPCAGFLGLACPTGLVCDITVPEACHGADLPGVCKVPPNLCLNVYYPVCGCDGKTYANDCVRLMQRVQLDHGGVCLAAD